MIKGIYNTAASMIPRVRKQEVIANNLANAETAGFKKDSMFLRVFKNEQNLKGLKNLQGPSWEVRMIDKLYIDQTEGALEATGRDLDLAIQGDGFFVLQTPNGEAYTRNGAFTVGPDGTLVSADGFPVLSEGGPITLTDEKVSIGSDGMITMGTTSIGRLRIVGFDESTELSKVSGTIFTAPLNAAPTPPVSATLRQGYLEKSNVDVMREMVEMIDSYRMFETGQKMIQIQDESLSKAVNELPRV